MGRQESSNAVAIAVILIAGGFLVLLLLVVAGGVFFFMAGSLDQSAQVTVASTTAVMPQQSIYVEADEDGTILVDGQAYSDQEYRDYLDEMLADGQVGLYIDYSFGDDVSPQRQEEIRAIYEDVFGVIDAPFDPPGIALPEETVFPDESPSP